MKIGIFTSGYQRGKIEEAFNDAKRFGYDYVELWGARPHAYPYDDEICVPEIKRLIEKYDMPVKIYTPEMNAYEYNMMWENDEMRADSIEYVKKSMDFAKAVGAEYTLISAGHAGHYTTYNEIQERLLDGLRKIVEHAEKIDHKVIYEALTIYESNVTTTANQLSQVLDEIDSPYLVGMMDIVVPYVQGENMLAYFDKLGDKMVHLHIIDSDGHTESHVCPGEGVLPLDLLMEELKEKNYNKTATIELVTNYLNEPSIYARRAIDNIRRYM